MLKKIIISLLAVCCVSAKSDFIGTKKTRPELFELTDNEVAIFSLSMPADQFTQLKQEAQKNNFGGMFGGNDDSFKTKNATLTVELNNNKKDFNKVTFSLGGSSSRSFGKQGYNLKIRGKDDLYGRTQFRLRPDAREATYLRSKLVCDMHNRLGLPSISANYAILYINDEYMGFYILMDAIKLSWVEYEYGDSDSTTLYQCKNMNNDLTVKTSSTGCTNENEEVTDNSEWIDLLTRLDAAQSAEDIEDIFDVDQFLTEIAFEYLSGSWDHYLNFGHNFYMYKPKNDKWKFMLYDFDGELGQDVSMGVRGMGFGQSNSNTNTDYPSYSFADWTKQRHLIDILILNDSTRFDNILRNFVTEVFNPATLFPHIDKLKEYIRPYVELDKIPDENGKYPGRINEGKSDYSLAQWDANCEFTSVNTSQGGSAYGLKYWILAKYRYVCKAYEIECDEKYLDENYQYTVDKEVEASANNSSGFGRQGGNGGFGGWGNQNNQGQGNGQSQGNGQNQGNGGFGGWGNQNNQGQGNGQSQGNGQNQGNGGFAGWGNQNNQGQGNGGFAGFGGQNAPNSIATNVCWSEALGYPCCDDCTVYYTDEDGEWGYDFINNEWCGIKPSCPF